MFSGFIHGVACIVISFFFKAEWSTIVWIYDTLFIHSPVDEHLNCLALAVVSNVVVSLYTCIGVQVPVWVPAFKSFVSII